MPRRYKSAALLPPTRSAWLIGLLLCACGDGGGGEGGGSLDDGAPATPAAVTVIAAWGDSLTSGIGADAGQSYPEQLGVLLDRGVFNGGISGQTSDQIAARQGGAPALLSLPDDSLPAAGSVLVRDASTVPVTHGPGGALRGELLGVRGTLTLDGGSFTQMRFTREQAGTPQSIPPRSAFTPDTGGRERQVNVFWVGHNNFFDPQAVIADTGRCVDFLDSDRFIVLSLLNTGNEPPGSDPYLRKTQINDALAARYPDRYLDVRRILVERYDPERADDVADHANDAPPASLRSDEEHLNAAGYAVIADAVAAFIRSKGW
jgi:lysophospholipase L1-like esterase